MINRTLTSGLFPVETAGVPLSPETPEGFRPYTLLIFVESFSNDPQLVSYRVLQHNESGAKTPLHEGTLHVPARGVAQFSSFDIPGKTLEVNLNLPSPLLLPTVQLIRTFLADGATQTVIWISPEQFVEHQSAAPGPNEPSKLAEHEEFERQRPTYTRHIRLRSGRRAKKKRQN